jgi:RNA polymerase sigma-70 factor, ECF subfamily
MVETEIIQKILAGDEKAFSLLVERYKDKSMILAVRMLKNNEDAEDVLQDAFVNAFKGLKYFEWKSSFSTWFYRIVYNLCLNALKKKKKNVTIDQYIVNTKNVEDFPEIDYADIDNYENKEIQVLIKEEISKLDLIYSSVLTLFYIQEFSCDEIVKITGMPLGTVKTRLSRGRNILSENVMKRMGFKTIKELEVFISEK